MADKYSDTGALTESYAETPEPSPTDNKRYYEGTESEAVAASEHASDITHYHVYKRRWFGIVCLAAMNIVTSWSWLSFAPIADACQEYFNLSSQSPINWLSTAIMFSYLVSSPVVWWLLGRFNIRFTIIGGAALTIVGSWVRYGGTKANNFGAVMFGQILVGFAQPFALSTPTFYTDLWFTSETRVIANCIASLSNPLGAAIGQLVGPAMVAQASDLPMFILVTSIVATAASFLCCLIPATPEYPPCPSAAIVKLHWIESLKQLARNSRYYILFLQFSVYVGFFNAFSTFTIQIMGPYGYSSDEAGIAGALLIFVGIVFSIITSIIVGRTKWYREPIMLFVPLIGGCYIATIFMCSRDANVAGPYVVSAVLGALSFSLLPIFLEWSQEQTSPVDPAVSSSLQWMGGQLFGAIFIIIMNALKYNDDQGSPPGNMRRALIFEAVIACVAAIPAYLLKSAKSDIRISMDREHRLKQKNEFTMS